MLLGGLTAAEETQLRSVEVPTEAERRARAAYLRALADDAPIDHKVAVLYTEQMGDEKRDTVEYTSDAFMGCEHTMLTYTRCMDSAPPRAADHRRPCACP